MIYRQWNIEVHHGDDSVAKFTTLREYDDHDAEDPEAIRSEFEKLAEDGELDGVSAAVSDVKVRAGTWSIRKFKPRTKNRKLVDGDK